MNAVNKIGTFIRNLVVVVIASAVLLWVLIGVVNYYFMGSPDPPPVKDAPWLIQTFSADEFKFPERLYYASEVVIENGSYTAITYWTYDGKTFHKHAGNWLDDSAGIITFSLEDYGDIKVKKRTGGLQ